MIDSLEKWIVKYSNIWMIVLQSICLLLVITSLLTIWSALLTDWSHIDPSLSFFDVIGDLFLIWFMKTFSTVGTIFLIVTLFITGLILIRKIYQRVKLEFVEQINNSY